MKSTLRQKKQRGALAVSAVFIALFIFTLAAVQLERLRLNSGSMFTEVEKTRRIYLARGAANQFLAQLVSSDDQTPISYSEDGYRMSARLVPAPSASPSPTTSTPSSQRPRVVTTTLTVQARAESEADTKAFKEVTMTLLKKESEAPRKFMRAPESETPDDAEPTIFAYRGDSSPWHVLPPVIRGGNPVAANDIIDLNPGPSGELFCLVRANPTNHLLRIGGTSDVTTWSWEDIGAIPTGLSDVKSVIVYGGRIYAIWGPARTNLSSSELGKPLWKTEIVTAGLPFKGCSPPAR